MNTQKNESVEAVQKSDVALREEAILQFWREQDIFNKSLQKDAPNGEFIFYDGPPFATGLPHYGHILASTIKDAVPRFWTMNGFRVPRKWGWDCHGLPLENLIEKKLGLATKRDIEDYGVQNFNEQARDAVLEYADDWKEIIPRMGRWADMENDYKTMDSTYTESVWSVFAALHKKGLVYEGFKSMHLCPRCGTTLSNFEVNQGYKDIKDIAVTVKLPLLDDAGKVTNTSLLVWTTTPWTLPGNMAAAVNNDIEYVKAQVMPNMKLQEDGQTSIYKSEFVILAKEILIKNPLKVLGEDIYGFGTEHLRITETFKGSDLVGKSYIPPFSYWTVGLEHLNHEGIFNAWKIYHADYVELGTEGTGAVHIAPAYGEDDMNLAKVHNIPIVHHVDNTGHFMDFVTDFAGQLVKPKDDDDAGINHKDADIEILKALQKSGKIFAKENITHSYPHCWRCDTPLLNYATTSWFIEVTKIKAELVEANAKVKWTPEHIGTSRFGKWLEGARDWAVSRQRYWGAPLPVWRNPVTKEYKVFASLKELQAYVPKSGNTYFKMRHGEADHNVTHITSSLVENQHHLTEKGRAQVLASAETLRDKNITRIYASPLVRTQETAKLVAEALGVPSENIIFDARLTENAGGVFEGKPIEDWYAYRNSLNNTQKITSKYEGGESWIDIQTRMCEVLFELDTKHIGENILIVSHGMPLRLLKWGADMLPYDEMIQKWESEGDFPLAKAEKIDFVPFPHNDNYALDYHRPYIDTIELFDTDGTKLERVPDVFDCWFESGAMPYAQNHYPFENLETFDAEKGKGFPAQFIAEGVDQTRGWFYSLIVLGVALFGKSPYEHVIVNGLVLAEDGKKMSKSLQNYPDPVLVANSAGVDAMRFYLLSSSLMRAEDLNFSEKGVLELQRKNIGRLHNVLAMYEMFADGTEANATSQNVLDRWIIARLNELVAESTAGFKNYELDKATRPITDFIDDVSVWYLRRSRDRFKSDDKADKNNAIATLRHVLRTLSLVMAPSMPFYAEYLWQRVAEESDVESIHLAEWPKGGEVDAELVKLMALVRNFATQGLNLRTQKNIKVRQPLSSFTVSFADEITNYLDECKAILADELNVKEVVLIQRVDLGVSSVDFNWEITEQLKAEGDVREFIRAVQDLRKQTGLEAKDRITLMVQASDGGEALVTQFKTEIMKVVGADDITFGNVEGNEVQAGDHSLTVQITKK